MLCRTSPGLHPRCRRCAGAATTSPRRPPDPAPTQSPPPPAPGWPCAAHPLALARLVPERLLSEWPRELGRLCGEGVPGALGLVLERQGVEGAAAAPSRGFAAGGGGTPGKSASVI